MEERINKALLLIESELRNIKAAREQVDSVVASSTQLQKKVGTFVSDVANLSKQVESLMDALEEKGANNLADFKLSLETLNKSCANIISSFEEKTTTATKSVKTEVETLHSEIEKLERTRNDLASATDAINKLNTDVEELTKELKKSQSAQDDLLRIINDQLTSLMTLSTGIDNQAKSIQQSLNNDADSLSQIILTFNKLTERIDSNKKSLDSALVTISESIKSYGEKSDKHAESLRKENHTLKIFTIIDTVLIIAAIIATIIK